MRLTSETKLARISCNLKKRGNQGRQGELLALTEWRGNAGCLRGGKRGNEGSKGRLSRG